MGGRGRPYLMENLPTHGVHTVNVGGRVAPEERQHRHSLFDTDGHALFARKMEEKVHTKRFVGQLPHAADCLAQQRRRMQLCLNNSQAARITDGGHQLWATHVGAHGRAQYRKLDTQEVTKSCV